MPTSLRELLLTGATVVAACFSQSSLAVGEDADSTTACHQEEQESNERFRRDASIKNPFVRVENDMESFVKKVLPPPDFVRVFALEDSDGTTSDSTSSLVQLGRLARDILDEHLHESGAVLFRNLGVTNARDFTEFWNGVKMASPERDGDEWIAKEYIPQYDIRQKLDGVDMASNARPSELVRLKPLR